MHIHVQGNTHFNFSMELNEIVNILLKVVDQTEQILCDSDWGHSVVWMVHEEEDP